MVTRARDVVDAGADNGAAAKRPRPLPELLPVLPRGIFCTLCALDATGKYIRFPKSKFECDSDHKYQFIKCIVGQYIDTRAIRE